MTHATGNGRGGVMQNRQGRPASRGNIETVAREDLHILGDHFRVIHIRLDKRIAGNQPIDLILCDARVFQCRLCRLDVELSGTQMWDDTNLGISCPTMATFPRSDSMALLRMRLFSSFSLLGIISTRKQGTGQTAGLVRRVYEPE